MAGDLQQRFSHHTINNSASAYVTLSPAKSSADLKLTEKHKLTA